MSASLQALLGEHELETLDEIGDVLVGCGLHDLGNEAVQLVEEAAEVELDLVAKGLGELEGSGDALEGRGQGQAEGLGDGAEHGDEVDQEVDVDEVRVAGDAAEHGGQQRGVDGLFEHPEVEHEDGAEDLGLFLLLLALGALGRGLLEGALHDLVDLPALLLHLLLLAAAQVGLAQGVEALDDVREVKGQQRLQRAGGQLVVAGLDKVTDAMHHHDGGLPHVVALQQLRDRLDAQVSAVAPVRRVLDDGRRRLLEQVKVRQTDEQLGEAPQRHDPGALGIQIVRLLEDGQQGPLVVLETAKQLLLAQPPLLDTLGQAHVGVVQLLQVVLRDLVPGQDVQEHREQGHQHQLPDGGRRGLVDHCQHRQHVAGEQAVRLGQQLGAALRDDDGVLFGRDLLLGFFFPFLPGGFSAGQFPLSLDFSAAILARECGLLLLL